MKGNKVCFMTACLLCLFAIQSSTSYAQSEFNNEISVRITKIRGSVYMLESVGGFGGGNIAASIGDDGILLVDNMYDWMKPRIMEAIRKVSDKEIRIVINTHFHTDHIGGNKNFKSPVKIFAHENTQKRVHEELRATEVVGSDGRTIQFNGESIRLIHFPNSHTDGDLIVYFEDSNVIHLGDMYFNGMFPAVYMSSGGRLKGLIDSIGKILEEMSPDAKIVPGHGDLSGMGNLTHYLTMLEETSAIVEAGIRNGKSLEQMQKDKVLDKYAELGKGGAQTVDQYLAMLYQLINSK